MEYSGPCRFVPSSKRVVPRERAAMNKNRVKWGVLGVASIATRKVIPGMQKGEWSEITAVASRELTRAKNAAEQLGIPKAYGSYEDLIADREIEAIYNPLPNHLHAPWSIKAAEAGKHVLCEKPIACNVAETVELLRVRDRTGVKIGEAFMVKTHPQWLRVRELTRNGTIGELKSIVTTCDQYTIQGDVFSRAIRENTEVPVPLEDALGNMRVIDAIFRSAKSGKWEIPA